MSKLNMTENANKIAFLVESYPKHTMSQIIALVQLPAIDINAAIWYATELGFIGEPDEKTGVPPLLNRPMVWNFGEAEGDLEDELVYCFKQLAKKETDLEENYLSNWTAGYSNHDTLIAVKSLEQEGVLAQYQIEDKENKYIFFTLAENKDKLWGQHQFKENPLASKGDTKAAPEAKE